MITAEFHEAIDAAKKLIHAAPILGGSREREDYESALSMVEYLIYHDADNPLIDLLSQKIAEYEDTAPEFAEFNARIAAIPQEAAALRTLMDQHGLKQGDLEGIIGGKSLVSMILNGKRELTKEHIKALSKHFGVPPGVFFDA